MKRYVGEAAEDLKIRIFADSGFAEDEDAMSVSGVFELLYGSNTRFPLHARSTKQGSVSHCTAEAEIVAIDLALQKTGIPAVDLWETILNRIVEVEYMEDNSACAQILKTGKNPTLRHVLRTQKVDIA